MEEICMLSKAVARPKLRKYLSKRWRKDKWNFNGCVKKSERVLWCWFSRAIPLTSKHCKPEQREALWWRRLLNHTAWPLPLRPFPDRSTFSTLVLVVTVVTTASSFVKPTANAYALNCFGLHLLYVLAVEMKRYWKLLFRSLFPHFKHFLSKSIHIAAAPMRRLCD